MRAKEEISPKGGLCPTVGRILTITKKIKKSRAVAAVAGVVAVVAIAGVVASRLLAPEPQGDSDSAAELADRIVEMMFGDAIATTPEPPATYARQYALSQVNYAVRAALHAEFGVNSNVCTTSRTVLISVRDLDDDIRAEIEAFLLEFIAGNEYLSSTRVNLDTFSFEESPPRLGYGVLRG
jgi:hypothetical protein